MSYIGLLGDGALQYQTITAICNSWTERDFTAHMSEVRGFDTESMQDRLEHLA